MLGIDLSLSNVGVIGNAAALPSFSLDFAAGDNPVTKYGFTFTRATAATYVNAAGNIATAASGELRYTYDPVTLSALGVLIEEQRQNLVSSSNSVGVNVGVSVSGSQASPDGATNASLITEDTGTSVHSAALASAGFSVTSGATYCASVFVKAGTANRVQLTGFSGALGAGYANFALVGSGSVLASSGLVSSGIQQFANGWYRIWIVETAASTATNFLYLPFINADAATRNPSYTGTGLTLYAFGCQCEAGAFPTSYIHTSGTAATRNADVLSLTGAAGRTNLLSYSEDFSNAAWSKAGLLAFGSGSTVDAVANPIDGSLTADKITEDSTTGIHAIYRTSSATSYNGSAMTMSFYALRAAGSRNINVLIASDTGFANFARYVVDLGSGSVSTVATGGTAPTSPSCTATAIGGGWYRVSVSATLATAGGYAVGIYIDNNTTASNDSYAGDGTSALYLYGAQLETGSSATAYIPTTNGPRTVENVAPWFNGDAGTWVAQVARSTAPSGQTGGTAPRAMTIYDSAATSYGVISLAASGSGRGLGATAAGTQWDITPVAAYAEDGSAYRIAMAYAENDVQVCAKGVLGTADTSAVMPARLQYIVLSGISNRYLNGSISSIRYYNRRLPNATLQSLTA